ncbi:MAG TPA: alkaline phosphatase family protein, partial [bacterium]|nr:alkaline phosphatase family protein [bacterium]
TPAEMVPGFVISDQFFEEFSTDRRAGTVRDVTEYPSTLYWDLPDADLGIKLDAAWQALEDYPGPYKENLEGMDNVDRDRFYAVLAPAVLTSMRPKLTLVTFYGTQSLGAHFWPYWEPQYFPDVFRQEVSRYHDILPGYYQYLDKVLSELITAVGPQTTVFVVSGYGMEPAIGAPDGRRACHGNMTPGILVASGDSIRQGFGWVERAELVDLASTILYLLGFPISNELDGRVLTEIVKEDFLLRHPIRQIPSYGPRLCITP